MRPDGPLSPSPTLRLACHDDIQNCARIYAEAFAEAPYYEEWAVSDAAELLATLLSRESETCFCLEYEGEVAGFAFCSTLGRFRAVVEEIAISPPYQCRGWGRLLLDHCLSVFQGRGFHRAELIANSSAPAFGFYRRLGFHLSRDYVLMLRDL